MLPLELSLGGGKPAYMMAIVGCSCDEVPGCQLWKLSPRCFHHEAVSSSTLKTEKKAKGWEWYIHVILSFGSR